MSVFARLRGVLKVVDVDPAVTGNDARYRESVPSGETYDVDFERFTCPSCATLLPLDLTADEASCPSCRAWVATPRDEWIAKRLLMGLAPLLPVLVWPDVRLRATALPVTPERRTTKAFWNRTRALAALVQHHQAWGISATQLGWNERVFVLRDDSQGPLGWTVCINPRLVIGFGGNVFTEEGCLSFPGAVERMSAPMKVRAMFEDIDGDPVDMIFENMMARAYVHELDHLDGKTLLHRMGETQRAMFLGRVEKARKAAQRRAD